MRFDDCRRWLGDAFPGTGELTRALGVLEASVESADSLSNIFEGAVGTKGGFGAIGIAHLQFCAPSWPEESARELGRRKLRAVEKTFERLNRLGAAFSLPIYRALVEAVLEPAAVARHPLLGLEWSAAQDRPEKATLYFTAGSAAAVERACSIVGTRFRPAVARRAAVNQECVGVDLFPAGGAALKLYNCFPLERRPELGPEDEALIREIGGAAPIKDVGFLTRVAPDGSFRPRLKVGLRLRGGTDAAELSRLPGLLRHRAFLEELSERLGGRRIYYVCFEDGELELLFRGTEPLWS
jgi:hypothetical protein